MNFQDLHELLRQELVRRIERGTVTGSRLAQRAGFQQAHISNFLNHKRALSLEGLDKVMEAQNLSIEQILPLDLAASAVVAQPEIELVQEVPIVSPSSAIDDVLIPAAAVIETVPVVGSRLRENRAKPAPRRTQWERFVAVRVDAQQAAAMAPVLAPGALAVIDRHYNSLAPYRANQPNIYALRSGSMLLLRYVDFDERHLILRPFLREFPVQLIGLKDGESPADYIVGRVCLVVAEV
ncbi:MAG: helix-turn-helix transcriptional regulator [Edaphobacter sp.]|uniref:helix-turn-helix domain-containing protein n=1 Tax=Edaphobacter sp. TaxID=1934404 RepID=UPI0023A007E1|nr:helix-turn-helix transcriptional regulator [Edaphobacter sp.]MDE1176733.1 helix-turn-helix transcriptional regulator [Edaphobacter sp.]